MGELNQKHSSVKFDYKFDRKWIEFLDTSVYIDQQTKLQTTLIWKSSDRQNFLYVKLEHSYLFKKVSATAKHFEFEGHAKHSKTTTVTLENLSKNTLIKDTKKMLP